MNGANFEAFNLPGGWEVVGNGTIGQPVGSLNYVRFQVKANVNGNPGYDPTGDVVQFAFLDILSHSADDEPVSWTNGSWETDTITGQNAYVAKILVGPAGSFVPTQGTNYWIWMKITDSPEVPVMQVGTLQVS
jgi:hypothetical protein